jgi:4-hydroxybenzoyl-CoA thioesterase
LPESAADTLPQEILDRLGAIPFTISRPVRWGDCDPAGVIYTPRVNYFVLEAIEDFQVALIGNAWGELLKARGMGAPTVRTEIDYLRPPHVEQMIQLVVRLERIGGASVTYRVESQDSEGTIYFRARHVSCYVDNDTFKPVAIPADIRSLLQSYEALSGAQ